MTDRELLAALSHASGQYIENDERPRPPALWAAMCARQDEAATYLNSTDSLGVALAEARAATHRTLGPIAALMGKWDLRAREAAPSPSPWKRAIEELSEVTGVIAGVGYDLTELAVDSDVPPTEAWLAELEREALEYESRWCSDVLALIQCVRNERAAASGETT